MRAKTKIRQDTYLFTDQLSITIEKTKNTLRIRQARGKKSVGNVLPDSVYGSAFQHERGDLACFGDYIGQKHGPLSIFIIIEGTFLDKLYFQWSL